MEYFRAPVFCDRTQVMSDPGGMVCLCGKALDLLLAWKQTAPGADSQCVHCRRCYDCRGQLISAVRAPSGRLLPRAPYANAVLASSKLRAGQWWTAAPTLPVPPALAPAQMPGSQAHAPPASALTTNPATADV